MINIIKNINKLLLIYKYNKINILFFKYIFINFVIKNYNLLNKGKSVIWNHLPTIQDKVNT